MIIKYNIVASPSLKISHKNLIIMTSIENLVCFTLAILIKSNTLSAMSIINWISRELHFIAAKLIGNFSYYFYFKFINEP